MVFEITLSKYSIALSGLLNAAFIDATHYSLANPIEIISLIAASYAYPYSIPD